MGLWQKLRGVFISGSAIKPLSKVADLENCADNQQENTLPSDNRVYGKAEKISRVSSLTERERDTYHSLLQGYTIKETANQLGIKYSTVNTHMTGLYKKLGINSRVQLVIQYKDIE